jgi:acyl-coenzyme A thioesterase PaaI-like protein
MDISEIPFSKFIGIQKSERNDDSIFKIEERNEFHNHLETLHASVLFALAESTSGEFLANQFKDLTLDVIPVVRKAEIKYSKPGKGTVYSKADFVGMNSEEIINELVVKGRVIIKVRVDVFNENQEKLLTSVFDWFIVKQ